MSPAHRIVWGLAVATAALAAIGIAFSTDALLLAMLIAATGLFLLGMHYDAREAERERERYRPGR